MPGSYNFQGQLQTMANIFQTNINLTEKANIYLSKMCPIIISKIVKELREEFEQQYQGQDDDKLNSIKNTLNMVEREKVSNLDYLFLDLAQQINTYYNKNYFSLTKTVPFRLKCQICENYVANDKYSFELHKYKCNKRKDLRQIMTPQMKKKKKFDTKQLYQKRLLNVCNVSQSTGQSQDNQNVKNQERKSKNKTIKQKRKQKSHPPSLELLKKILSKQIIKKEQSDHFGERSQSQGLSIFFTQSDDPIQQHQESISKIKQNSKHLKIHQKHQNKKQLEKKQFDESDQFLG